MLIICVLNPSICTTVSQLRCLLRIRSSSGVNFVTSVLVMSIKVYPRWRYILCSIIIRVFIGQSQGHKKSTQKCFLCYVKIKRYTNTNPTLPVTV